MALNEAQKKERSEYLEKNLEITECSQGKPYIFVSYASDDWESVFKTAVVPMQKQYGLRVYADRAFDEAIDKWIVPMLRNIRGADVVVAFISQSYIENYACFLELLTAANNKKQIVFVSLGEQLRLGASTDLSAVEDGVKSEILNQGANIVTNTTNTSNAVMRAMKSAYISILTLLEQDALSKYDITDAFINFFRDAAVKQKTVNDLRAVKRSIGSVSRNVFAQSLISEAGHKAEFADPVRKPASIPVERPDSGNRKEGFAGKRKDFRRQRGRFKAGVIGGVVFLAIVIIIAAVILGGLPRNVTDRVYALRDGTTGTYTGKWQDGKPNGQGRMEFDDGNVYEGEWQGGRMNGQGALTFANGDVQEGEWKDDVPNGYSTMQFAGGDVIEGEWKDGLMNGQGTIRYAGGDAIEGEFKDNQLNGRVTYTDADGNVTISIWEEGEQIAEIVTDQVYETSDGKAGAYTGEWWDNMPSGQGRMEFENGEVYEGQWIDGQRSGQGKCTWSNGDSYEGEWKDNKPNGQGIGRWSNGDVYEGEWKDGKPGYSGQAFS